MVHFEQNNAKTWTAKHCGRAVGTLTELTRGYDGFGWVRCYEVKHADGFCWIYDTLDAAQDSFLDPDE